MNQVYDNFVLENKLETLLTTKVDLSNYMTVDYSLTENPGMLKTIHKYVATGNVEDLAMTEGNSEIFESTYTSADYRVGVTQAKGRYYDEEYMKDPMVLDTIVKGMAEQMANDFTKKAIAEMKKAELIVPCDFSTSTSGYFFGKVVDGLAKFKEEQDGLTLLINPNQQAYVRKQLGDDLKYSEGFARTGYIGSISGVPVVVSNAVPDSCAFIVNKEAVTLFIKKGAESEQFRDPDHRKNELYLRKVAVVGMTNSTKIVELAKEQSTTCAITTYVKDAKTVAGTCGADCYKVVFKVGSAAPVEVIPSNGTWTGNAAENLATGDKVNATAYCYGFAPKAATEVTVA